MKDESVLAFRIWLETVFQREGAVGAKALTPVKVVEDRYDVVRATGGGEHVGSRVLDILEFIEDVVR